MSIIKEFREFFLRNTQVTLGSKQDQELGFPLTHFVDGQTKYNRLIRDNVPTENVMRKFLESITFKLNNEDTASETIQGLTKLCNNTQYTGGTDTDVSGFTLSVKPSQIRNELGDRVYTTENYVTGSMTFTEAIDALDVALAAAPSASIPTGVITMWSGAIGAIPSGWRLCDGTSGTPNLSGRFIVGYDALDSDYNTIGNTAGEKQHTLTTAELPAHSHRTFNSSTGGGLETKLSSGAITEVSSVDGVFVDSENTGSGNSHENRPPYYTLAYIIKL